MKNQATAGKGKKEQFSSLLICPSLLRPPLPLFSFLSSALYCLSSLYSSSSLLPSPGSAPFSFSSFSFLSFNHPLYQGCIRFGSALTLSFCFLRIKVPRSSLSFFSPLLSSLFLFSFLSFSAPFSFLSFSLLPLSPLCFFHCSTCFSSPSSLSVSLSLSLLDFLLDLKKCQGLFLSYAHSSLSPNPSLLSVSSFFPFLSHPVTSAEVLFPRLGNAQEKNGKHCKIYKFVAKRHNHLMKASHGNISVWFLFSLVLLFFCCSPPLPPWSLSPPARTREKGGNSLAGYASG